MNVFSVKSIGLYAIAIASAIVFFNFIANYGEANVIAPMSIAGNYRINDADRLPGCLQNKPLLLKLQQSGIYLNAAIVADLQDRSTAKENPTLSGRFRDRQINLAGKLPATICRQSQLQIAAAPSESARAASKSPQQLAGKLWLISPDTNSTFTFTATKQ